MQPCGSVRVGGNQKPDCSQQAYGHQDQKRCKKKFGPPSHRWLAVAADRRMEVDVGWMNVELDIRQRDGTSGDWAF